MANQQLPTEKSKPSHKIHHREEDAPLHPDPPIKIPEKNLPRQGRSDVGANLHPNPIHKEGHTTENLKVLETLLSNRFAPPADYADNHKPAQTTHQILRGHGRLSIWLPNTPRSTNGSPKGTLGTATGNEGMRHSNQDRLGF